MAEAGHTVAMPGGGTRKYGAARNGGDATMTKGSPFFVDYGELDDVTGDVSCDSADHIFRGVLVQDLESGDQGNQAVVTEGMVYARVKGSVNSDAGEHLAAHASDGYFEYSATETGIMLCSDETEHTDVVLAPVIIRHDVDRSTYS